MIIENLIADFLRLKVNVSNRRIAGDILMGGKPYSLNTQFGYQESEYLPENIRNSVQGYTRDKDKAIEMYKIFVAYLKKNNVPVHVEFPPVSISSSFDRQLFIAKYLQSPGCQIKDLENILWVSQRTIEKDIARLRGDEDPIEVCGRRFTIPEMERDRGTMHFLSTAHPLFLTENLTQILVLLKGLKKMSEEPLLKGYALQTASEIWMQLSPYAKNRIHFVLRDILPDDLQWYEKLAKQETESFHTETFCSHVRNTGPSAILECIKNGKPFCVEYLENDENLFFTNCIFKLHSYGTPENGCTVISDQGEKQIQFNKVIRSAYTIEELMNI